MCHIWFVLYCTFPVTIASKLDQRSIFLFVEKQIRNSNTEANKTLQITFYIFPYRQTLQYAKSVRCYVWKQKNGGLSSFHFKCIDVPDWPMKKKPAITPVIRIVWKSEKTTTEILLSPFVFSSLALLILSAAEIWKLSAWNTCSPRAAPTHRAEGKFRKNAQHPRNIIIFYFVFGHGLSELEKVVILKLFNKLFQFIRI